MESSEGNFFTILAISIIALIVLYFFLDNLSFFKNDRAEEEPEITPEEASKESPMAQIFHLYNHESEKQWFIWVTKQNKNIKSEAAKKLTDHLQSKPEKWGYLTLEALNCLKGFKEFHIEDALIGFISKTGSLWREYKSIPNYYQKATEVLAMMNPAKALEIFKEEFQKRSNTDISIEKKRILVNNLSLLGPLVKDLIVEILTSNYEDNSIKSHVLRECRILSEEIKRSIYLESTNNLAYKYKTLTKPLRMEEAALLEDLTEDSLAYIANYDFHIAINSLLKNPMLTGYVITAITKILNKEGKSLTLLELFSLTRLHDNSSKDIKRLLAKRNNLELNEINNIILQSYIEDFSEDNLKNKFFESDFPIPNVYTDFYKEFKNLFLKSIDEDKNRTCEKNFGGVLMFGTEIIEKLYFSRALAREKEWSFAYIDLENLIDKNSFQEMHDEIFGLSKPCLIYFQNPQALLCKKDSSQNIYREKFLQMLTIQSLDSKVFFAGDIPFNYSEVEQKQLKEPVKTLCSKFFPFTTEINPRSTKIKLAFIEDLLKNISTHRFEKRRELINDLMENGKDKNVLEFIFYVLNSFVVMLLVFGRDTSYRNIESLREQFKSNVSKNQIENDFESEDITSEIPL